MNTPESIAIVSGYFNPIHVGHLKLIHAAKEVAPFVVVIVNNDVQQLLKKNKIIMSQEDRLAIAAELRSVDVALLAVDDDRTVIASLELIRSMYPTASIAFCNGGDRSSASAVPSQESVVCAKLGIQMHYGVGGTEKADSSTRITSAFTA
jgi:cytidyltransferase-like protein